MGPTREWEAQDVESGLQIEPASATGFDHLRGASEVKTGKPKAVARGHGEDGPPIETRAEGDEHANVGEEVQQRRPHDRPWRRIDEVGRREAMDPCEADRTVDVNERLEGAGLVPELDSRGTDRADAHRGTGGDFDVDCDESVHRREQPHLLAQSTMGRRVGGLRSIVASFSSAPF